MINYRMYQKNPSSHYIYIDMMVGDISTSTLQLQLPAWRPGRYELGNFAKNIKRVDVFNENNEPLSYTKLNKDLWEVDTQGARSIKITYSYYAAELNAGSCFADASQVYVNPVHCCMYVPGRTDEEHHIDLQIPDSYRIATSLKQKGNVLMAANYEELVDSPFMASATIKSDSYDINGIRFHLHFYGECRPDFEKLKKDFRAFTQKQFDFWNDFHSSEYHFLIQVLPTKFYHGVEHKKNTVIAIGPGYAINSGPTYDELLGVSCHELFHVWNIKTIRPAEMMPYDFTKENYARTGYVYEGFTTYYGDKLLLASNVYSQKQYLETLQERMLKHFHNFGRFNLSVAQSSWETWLDGYVPGAPYRKTNIYDEGSLIAFMLDVQILEASSLKKSLRDVCVLLYERFGKKQIGYSETDVISAVNEISGINFEDFFKRYVYTPGDFEPGLQKGFDFLGIKFTKEPSSLCSETHFGFKTQEQGGTCKVTLVAPYSPAWKAGLFAGDEIVAVNSMMVKNNLNHWLLYFSINTELEIQVNCSEQLKTLVLQKDQKGNTYFFKPLLSQADSATAEQQSAYAAWAKG
ncbi:MAG: PDZ domain-containing protein [bacterium]|nr:PDZ domain-containing protein [bacterium]